MNRRSVIWGALSSGLVVAGGRAFGRDGEGERKMTKCLSCGAIGVGGDQRRAIALAGKHGFEAVEASPHFLAGLGAEEMDALNAERSAKDLVWGNAGLPVEFRKDAETFSDDLEALPALAGGLRRAGVRRVSTWLMPCHDELTYGENFAQHVARLREVAKVLGDEGLLLGFEYVGTTTLRASKQHPFIHSLAGTKELTEAIGTGNVGYVLDSWHWWQAGDSAAAIRELKPEEIALVDLNDAPKGVEKDAQLDGQRELPMATRVIDLHPFLAALLAIGYDGPVRAEPFNQPLRDMEDDAACAATSRAMDAAFAVVG